MDLIFVDADVCLDLLADRPPFNKSAAQLFTMADRKKITIQVSSLTFGNLHYILRKEYSSLESRKILQRFKVLVQVLALHDKIVELALQSDFRDFEDALQYFSALEGNAKGIVTRNLKDFRSSEIPVLTPESYLKTVS